MCKSPEAGWNMEYLFKKQKEVNVAGYWKEVERMQYERA